MHAMPMDSEVCYNAILPGPIELPGSVSAALVCGPKMPTEAPSPPHSNGRSFHFHLPHAIQPHDNTLPLIYHRMNPTITQTNFAPALSPSSSAGLLSASCPQNSQPAPSQTRTPRRAPVHPALLPLLLVAWPGSSREPCCCQMQGRRNGP